MEDGISGWLQHRHKTCCEKDGHHRRQTCIIWRWYCHGNVISRQVDMHMTVIYMVVLRQTYGHCQARFTPGWKSTEWTRRWADLWNNLGFSLCAAPSVCHVVATSDEGEGVWVGVSAEWCVAVEHRRSSSIRDYLRRLSD